MKYYLYYLEERGVYGIKGRIDYPLLKKTEEVELSEEDRQEILIILKKIKEITSKDIPPELRKKSICKSCAYYDLCFI